MNYLLKDVLQLNDRYRERIANENSLGDAFLCKTNILYRKVRESILKSGYVISDDHLSDFYSCPLLGLNSVLKERKLYAWRNLFWLRKLEKEKPSFYKLKDLNFIPIKPNYLFHESAHVIAYKLTFKNWKQFETSPKNEGFLFKIMLAESFANSCEALVQLKKPSPIELYLHNNNFYYLFTKDQRCLLTKAVSDLGIESAGAVLLIGFLYANYLYKELDTKDVKRILGLTQSANQPTARNTHLIQELLISLPLQLSAGFRLQTTRIYLTTIGFTSNIFKELDLDPGVYLEKHPELLDIIKELSSSYFGASSK